VRLFELHRDEDPTGVSGPGIVASGVEFDDGTVVIRWRSEHASTVVWDSIHDAVAVHGHVGRTRFVFLGHDGQPLGEAPEPVSRTQRGFADFASFTHDYGGTVTVRQSSNAEVDAVWLFVANSDDPVWREKAGVSVGAHLTADMAATVRDALNVWLHSIGDPRTWRTEGTRA